MYHDVRSLILVFILFVACLHLSDRLLPSLEGALFDLVIRPSLLLSFYLVLVALMKFLILSYSFKRILRRLAAHPIVAAYTSVPDSLTKSLGKYFYLERPSLSQLVLTVDHYGRFERHHGRDLDKQLIGSIEADLKSFEPDSHWAGEQSIGHYRRVWDSVAAQCVDWQPPLKPQPAAAGTQGQPQAQKKEEQTWITPEVFVVARVVFVLREILLHLRNYLFFATVASLLLLATVAYYPLQPKRLLMMILCNLILAITGFALLAIIQLNRDEILSRLFDTEINKVSWNKEFITRIAFYVLFPLLSLLAAQFPELGSLFVSFVEPIQRAMP